MATVNIQMDGDDFDRLSSVAMPWAQYYTRPDGSPDGGWSEQIQKGRFVARDGTDQIGSDHHVAFWFENWASVILARSYLQELGYQYQVLSDEIGDGLPWVVLTSYGRERFGG